MSFVLDDIVYIEDNDNKICLVKCMEVNKSSVKIPAIVNGFTVVGIYDNAFSFNPELEEILLPDTVRKIGDYAFTSCYHLKTVEFYREASISAMHKANTLILGEQAFLYCYELETVNIIHKRLHIKHQCFDGCMSLTNLTGVIVSAQADSFIQCDKLISLTIANETHVDFLNMSQLPKLKMLSFGNKASVSESVAQGLAENAVVIYCPHTSNMMDLSYLGCVIHAY